MLSNLLLPTPRIHDQREEFTSVEAQIDLAEDTKLSRRPVHPVIPSCREKYLLTCSMLKRAIHLLRRRHQPCKPIEAGTQGHSYGPDDQNRKQKARDGQIVLFHPGQVSHAQLAEQHLYWYHRHQGAPKQDVQTSHAGGRCRWQDDGEETPAPGEL